MDYKQIQKTSIFFIICIYLTLGLAQSSFAKASTNVFANRYAEIVIDANTGNTIFSANENAKRYPASLTKLMTLYILFDNVKAGRLSLNTPIPVSKHAASMPPTKIGFTPGDTISAANAAKAMITKSANDVAAAVGEYLGGTEENFAKMMTLQAHRLGMMNTHFNNASGLPDPQNYTTARDLATLCLNLRYHFPDLYYLFKTTSFNYNGRIINGHNHILKDVPGVDGLKTGYTQMSGFNLATSYHAHNKNLVAVIMGWRSAALRDARMSSLLRKFIPNAYADASLYHSTVAIVPRPTFKHNVDFSILNSISQRNANPIRASLYSTKSKSHTIQIGTAKSQKDAEHLYKKILHKNHSITRYNKQITRINTHNSHLYRIRLTNINNKTTAQNICRALKKEKFLCFVVN